VSGKLLSREAESTASVPEIPRASRWKHWVTPAIILLMAAAIVVLITGNWNRWIGERASQEAALTLARVNLGYTRITALEGGIVSERRVRPGQLVSPGTQVISLIQRDVWVQANYKETQVRHMRPGDPAEIRVDAFPGVILRGKVDQVAPASGSQFALLPPDNATGNFTKIVQRVPVKIVLDPGQATVGQLRPGLSVIAAVRTNGAGN
jgi:membrane fusion protein (multidrug efflux system)